MYAVCCFQPASQVRDMFTWTHMQCIFVCIMYIYIDMISVANPVNPKINHPIIYIYTTMYIYIYYQHIIYKYSVVTSIM